MDDGKFGTKDSRGYWKPVKRLTYPDVFVWPLRLHSILAWLPGYLFPWTAIYAVLSLLMFFLLTPEVARMRVATPDRIGQILLRNYRLLIAIVVVQHYWFYIRRAQGTAQECQAWCLYANGHIAQMVPSAHPIWFALLWLLVPLLHEFHFTVCTV